jgi:hypothetical protein
MSDSIPQIDFTKIAFPSDRITVKSLRDAFPHSFDLPAHSFDQSSTRSYERGSVAQALDGIIDAERLLAGIAFKRALGQPMSSDEGRFDRSEFLDALETDYGRVGLASGAHQVEELMRAIEAQAVEQARHHLGRSP